jgi:hypothetical protein
MNLVAGSQATTSDWAIFFADGDCISEKMNV